MMSTNKQAQGKSSDEAAWSDLDDDETMWLSNRQRHLRTMVGRAIVTYFVLFLCLGVIMSAFGVMPLARDGLMPKILFVFVGLSLIIALANTIIEDWSEHRQTWLGLIWRNWRSKSSEQTNRWK